VHHENATSRAIWKPQQLEKVVLQSHARFFDRWGAYLKGRIGDERDPDPLPAICWEARREVSTQNAVALYLNEPLGLTNQSHVLLDVASIFQSTYSVVLVFENLYSRCRVYSLCRHFQINLTRFDVGVKSELGDKQWRAFVDLAMLGGERIRCTSFAGDHRCEVDKLLTLIDSAS
jgi:hypothetical protein